MEQVRPEKGPPMTNQGRQVGKHPSIHVLTGDQRVDLLLGLAPGNHNN